jgi:DNA-3-methyladenine glycosylase II
MKIVIDKAKLRPLEPSTNAFQSLVRSIIYQQLSGKAAASILKKFIALWPKKKFPTPADVLLKSDTELRSAGLSFQKISYISDLATKFLDGTVSPKKFPKMSDEEIKEHLVAVKGIGPWTADMFLMFALNRPNILPVGDLAIRKGFQKAFKLKKVPTEKEMRKLAQPYEGEHTYLSLYLWGIMDGEDTDW